MKKKDLVKQYIRESYLEEPQLAKQMLRENNRYFRALMKKSKSDLEWILGDRHKS